MRALSENERDEIEAVKYLCKYVLTQPDVPTYKIWDALRNLEIIGKKFVISGIVTEEELNELIELDDMKDVLDKFMERFLELMNKHVQEM